MSHWPHPWFVPPRRIQFVSPPCAGTLVYPRRSLSPPPVHKCPSAIDCRRLHGSPRPLRPRTATPEPRECGASQPAIGAPPHRDGQPAELPQLRLLTPELRARGPSQQETPVPDGATRPGRCIERMLAGRIMSSAGLLVTSGPARLGTGVYFHGGYRECWSLQSQPAYGKALRSWNAATAPFPSPRLPSVSPDEPASASHGLILPAFSRIKRVPSTCKVYAIQ